MASVVGILDAQQEGHGSPSPNRTCSSRPSSFRSLRLHCAPSCHYICLRPPSSPAAQLKGSRSPLTIRTQTPVYNLLETPRTPEIKSQLFLTDDPALVVLYSQLRQQTLQTLRGASKVTPYAEWQFVLHSAKIYDRMGCDLLGLDLGELLSLSGVLHGK